MGVVKFKLKKRGQKKDYISIELINNIKKNKKK